LDVNDGLMNRTDDVGDKTQRASLSGDSNSFWPLISKLQIWGYFFLEFVTLTAGAVAFSI